MTKQRARTGLALVGLLSGVSAQEKIEELEPVTVLAKKFAAEREETTSSTGVVKMADLVRMQRSRLLDAFDTIPGVQALSTAGLEGSTGSAIFRGLPTPYAQVVVDGVRITDATNDLGNFLANGNVGGLSKLEVLRGPQSVLYGTGAAGGVIGLETAVGDGEPRYQLFGEGGSFDSYRFSLSSKGQVGALQYGVEFGRYQTGNDTFAILPRHDYEQDQGSLALQWRTSKELLLKFSYRGNANVLRTTSMSGPNFFTSDILTKTHLLALNAEYKVNPDWKSKLTLGYYDESYKGDFGGGFGPSIFGTSFDRLTLNWNHQIQLSETFELLTGLEYSDSHFNNSSGRRTNYDTGGAYVNGQWKPVEGFLLEGGLRYDEHSEFDGDIAWNLGGAIDLGNPGTRFRARVSQAYRTPSRLDSASFAGAFSSQAANANLDSEEILGFEIGLDHDFGGHQLELGYFQQELKDAIVTRTIVAGFPSVTQRQNRAGSSTVSGFELALSGELGREELRYRLAWTQQTKEEVIDVPDRIVGLDLSYDGGDWLVGVGVSHVAGASYGSDPVNFLSTDGRTLTRLYGEYQVNEHLKLHARVENLFDEEYLLSDIFGTQLEDAGRAVSVGATIEW
ncbi:TonB-dependent receptor [Akkermansiaceae bacterium]|nr:TonB-dependent receptor [Akkermansiaceae bacterium]MDA7888437.1 TonB-dependent receptor [Akkermansiaceae bacterium]MDB4537492.1 TonB-dependent receptor [Akkermansiaceae bacterium]